MITIIISINLFLTIVLFLQFLLKKEAIFDYGPILKLEMNLEEIRKKLIELEKNFKEDFKSNRIEITDSIKELKKETTETLEKKLEYIRVTVDEKLQKTLNERLGQSFESVSKQLLAVQNGLGEMRNLASDVGGLKKVLQNVKIRGSFGELQLSLLLEQILSPNQYAANVKTKPGSKDLVEFAIKLPGQEENSSPVWLPIDAKFPKEYYEQLQSAYDLSDMDKIELAQKNLENAIKKMAKDISSKYISPPNTTDFAILFLPFEGIYAEVVRKAALLEEVQRDYKVIIAGPTTFAALLNSLQMGFKTLAIQKSSSEVWKILGQVKAEFENFGGILDKVQKNFQNEVDNLDKLIGVRTRAINNKLKSIESIPTIEKNETLY